VLGPAAAVQRLDPHALHERVRVPATDLVSLPARLLAVAGSVVRGLKIQFIEPPHQPQIPLRHRPQLTVHARARQIQRLRLLHKPHHSESVAPNWPRKWDNVTWTEIHSYPCPKPEPPFPSELARESGSGSPVIRRARVSLCREMLELPMGGLDDGRAWKVRKLECETRP